MRTPVRSCGRGRRRIPTAPRWIRSCGGPPCRPPSTNAGGLDDVAAVSVGAQQHGMVCLDEAGEVVRDALLWNDTRSSCGGGRARRRARRSRGMGEAHRCGARRRDHGEQAALARRPRTRARRCDRRGVPAARLADVAAERFDRHRRPVHRPQRRQRDRLLLRRDRQLPTRSARAGDAGPRPAVPTVLGPHDVAGQTPGGADARSRCGRQRRCGAGSRRRNPATASSRWAPPAW